MKNRLGLFNVLALAGIAAVFTPSVRAGDGMLCPAQNLVMRGTYVLSGSGTVVGVGPIATVGQVVYNGDGTSLLVTSTRSVNGAVSTSESIPGTYTVNSDCTGTKTFGTGPGASQFSFVITPDGSKITWIVTNSGVTMAGSAERMSR